MSNITSSDSSSTLYLHTRDDIISAFADMRDELDEHNDRRERLVEVSLTISVHEPNHRQRKKEPIVYSDFIYFLGRLAEIPPLLRNVSFFFSIGTFSPVSFQAFRNSAAVKVAVNMLVDW